MRRREQTDSPTSQTPSSASEYYDLPEIPLFDGAFDDKPTNCNTILPARSYKLSDLRKGAISKVKNITANVGNFPVFRPRGRSRSRRPTNETEPVVIGAQARTFPVASEDSPKRVLAEKSPNRRLVPAIKSALNFTNPYIENEHEEVRELLKPETPTGSPTTRGTTPTIPLSEKRTRSVPLLLSHNSTPNTSTESLNRIENFGVQRLLEKDIFDRRTFEGLSLHKERGASLTPTRSTNDFRYTVRKIIVEGNQAEDLRNFSNTFKLATPMPADIATITSRSASRMDTSDISGVQTSLEHTNLETEGDSNQVARTPIRNPKEPKVSVKFGRDKEDKPESVANFRRSRQKKMVEGLREFGRTFQLPTPVPEDIAAIMKIDTSEQTRELAAKEETKRKSRESQSLEMPSPGVAAMSDA